MTLTNGGMEGGGRRCRHQFGGRGGLRCAMTAGRKLEDANTPPRYSYSNTSSRNFNIWAMLALRGIAVLNLWSTMCLNRFSVIP